MKREKKNWRVEYEIPPCREILHDHVLAATKDKAMGIFYTRFQSGQRVRKIEPETTKGKL